MKTQVYGLDGNAVREIELSDTVFGRDVSEGSIYHAIRNELANKRLGTAKIKDRGEVHSSNKKPWKQKGTGRARSGQRSSPVWVGGGKIFGPAPAGLQLRASPEGEEAGADVPALAEGEGRPAARRHGLHGGKRQDEGPGHDALQPRARTRGPSSSSRTTTPW